MPKSVSFVCILAGLVALPNRAPAEVPDEYLAAPLAEFFGAPPSIGEPMLSPDGSHLLFLQQDPAGVTMLRSLNLTDGSLRTLLQGSERGHDILWCDFAAETRLLCDLREGIPGRAQEYQRFFALDLDGSELTEMLRGTGCHNRHYYTDKQTYDRLPDDDEEVLFICNRAATFLNTYSRQLTDISGAGEVGRRQTLYSNGHGLPNLYVGRTDDLDRWMVRWEPDAGEWEEFYAVSYVDFDHPLRPVGYGTNLERVFNIGWNDETGTWGLFRKNLREPYENELIFAHGAVDIELVDTLGPNDRVVSVAFLDGRAQRAIVDRRVGEVYQFVSGLLPGIDIEIVDESWDQTIYLARARAPRSAAELLLINMETEQVTALPPEYEHLAGYELAQTEIVRFEGSDGGLVTAHLTLPYDELEGPVPAVVVPRSWASHEDVADPHYLVEFLAARGFAVLRVQNRVEPDFGSGWIPETAVVGWNRTADDIASAVDYLVANGVSAEGRVCALGKNYGAYSAFMSAIKYPDLFECIVSIAGITDPRLTPGAEVIRRNVSGVSEDLLDVASPVKRAAEVEPAVLMFHGENDADVSMADHTVTLYNVLDRADKDVRFIEYPQGNHQIRRGPYRIDMLTRIGEFLEARIGPAVPRIETSAADAPAAD